MRSRDFSSLIWGDALSLLEQAERLQRQFFTVGAARTHVWEPPVDILETADAVLVYVALPGAAPDTITIGFEPDAITIAALRPFAAATSGGARIHRVEIPYGRFARRIPLPMHALELAERTLANGCLTLLLAKRERAGPDARGPAGGTR